MICAFATVAHAQHIADQRSRREAISHYRAGQELMSAEKFEQAVEEFSKAIKSDALFSLAHYGLGQAYMNLQRYASAAKAYQGCLEAFRELYQLEQTNRAAVERQRDDEIVEMQDTLRRMTQNTPSSPRVLQLEQQLADIKRQKPSLDGAFHPPAAVLLALGSAHFRNGDRDEAETEWKAAIDANPKLGEAHNNLAVIYMQTGRLDEADQEIKAAEKAGFHVNPQFKDDLNQRRKSSS
jgi:tetratricopeptide (TPR) repeat protein